VRAGRLIGLVSLLQARGRMTARQLAAELEVSERTIVRDIEALISAGIPVYPVRGCQGGFELLAGFRGDVPAAGPWPDRPGARRPAAGGAGAGAGASAAVGPGARRARVRLSPRGRRLAALLGRPADVRVRRNAAAVPERPDWVEASVRIESVGAAVLDMLALGAEVEVLHPAALRAEVGETARRLASLYADDAAGPALGPAGSAPGGAGPVPGGAGPVPGGAGPAPVPGPAVPADLS
jgi:predicted DNA-binding transcriptional regulator YafY